MVNSKNIKYLGKKSKIPDSPDDIILDTVKPIKKKIPATLEYKTALLEPSPIYHFT